MSRLSLLNDGGGEGGITRRVGLVERKNRDVGLVLGSLDVILRVGSVLPVVGPSLRTCRDMLMEVEGLHSRMEVACSHAMRIGHSLLTINAVTAARGDLAEDEEGPLWVMLRDVQEIVAETRSLLQSLAKSSRSTMRRASVFVTVCKVARTLKLIETNTALVENVVRNAKTIALLTPQLPSAFKGHSKRSIPTWRAAPTLRPSKSLPALHTTPKLLGAACRSGDRRSAGQIVREGKREGGREG